MEKIPRKQGQTTEAPMSAPEKKSAEEIAAEKVPTPTEKEMRDKGLVIYHGEWVRPEDLPDLSKKSERKLH